MQIDSVRPVQPNLFRPVSSNKELPLLGTGDVISARILSVENGQAVVQMLGANVEALTSALLTPGATVLLTVAESAAGQIVFKVLPEGASLSMGVAPTDAVPTDEESMIESALARAGLPADNDHAASIKQGLASGLARSADTLALIKSSGLEPGLAATGSLDALLAEGSPKLGSLLSQFGMLPLPSTLAETVPSTDMPVNSLAETLRAITANLLETGKSVPANTPIEIGNLLRGQAVFNAIKEQTTAAYPFFYIQLPYMAGGQWRTVEMRMKRRNNRHKHGADWTDEIVLRFETARFGDVEARISTLGKHVKLAFKIVRSDNKPVFDKAIHRLQTTLEKRKLIISSITSSVVASLPPLPLPQPTRLDARG